MKYIIPLLVLMLTACSIPKNPEDSLQKAREHGLEVGIVYHPPYTDYKNGVASGTEAALIEGFAAKERLKINYTYGTESELIKKLEEYKLHIVIGGFEAKTIWKEKVGVTTAYNQNKNCFLIAPGENDLLYHLESYLLKHKDNGN